MFDLISINEGECTHELKYVDRNITIKRAPTDESVKLLAELEQKAYDKIKNSLKLESNIFKGILHFYGYQIINDSFLFKVIFKMNDKLIDAEYFCRSEEIVSNGIGWVLDNLKDEIFKKISSEITHKFLYDDIFWEDIQERAESFRKLRRGGV